MLFASLRILLGKFSRTTSTQTKKKMQHVFTLFPTDKDQNSVDEFFTFQSCVPSFQELKLIKIRWTSLLDYHLYEFVVYQYHHSFGDHVWRILLMKCASFYLFLKPPFMHAISSSITLWVPLISHSRCHFFCGSKCLNHNNLD